MGRQLGKFNLSHRINSRPELGGCKSKSQNDVLIREHSFNARATRSSSKLPVSPTGHSNFNPRNVRIFARGPNDLLLLLAIKFSRVIFMPLQAIFDCYLRCSSNIEIDLHRLLELDC